MYVVVLVGSSPRDSGPGVQYMYMYIKDCIITRQESAQKMWGLRTTVHEDWKGT